MINCIELKNVSFFYDKTKVLSNISSTFEAGKFYGILGPNGCGKTTLLDIIAGIKRPATGDVLLAEKNIGKYKKKDLAQQISLVPQEFRLDLGFTVEEVVMMGRHPYIGRFASPNYDDFQAVNRAIEEIGLNDFRHVDADKLSGGQKQRVLVARALAQQAEITLFDEATANLDISHSLQIFAMAQKRVKQEGKTAIAVLHNLNLAAAYCDEIILLHKGELHDQGNPAKVLSPKNILKVFNAKTRIGKDLYGQDNQTSLYYPKL